MAQRNYLISTTGLSLTASGTTIGSGNVSASGFAVARTLVRTGLSANELDGSSQTWTIHYVVSAMTTPYNMRLKIQRRNSSGVVQSESSYGTTRSATGTYDDNITWASGTWNANDQLALVWEHERPSGTGNKNATIDANGSSYIDAPQATTPLTRTLSDDANAWADGLGIVLGQRISGADNANNLADASASVLDLRLSLVENINNLADGFSRVLALHLSSPDTLNSWDDVLYYHRRPRWQDSFSSQLNVADSSALTLSLSDNLNNLNDSLTLGYGLVNSDSIALWDDAIWYHKRPRWSDSLNKNLVSSGALTQSLSDSLRLNSKESITFFSANLQHGEGTDGVQDFQRQLDALVTADIVAVQERTEGETGWNTPLANAGFVQAIYRINDVSQNDGSAIWYKSSRVNVLQVYEHDLSEGASTTWSGNINVDKSAVAAKVQVAGKIFYVVSTHLAWSAGADSDGSTFSAIRVAQIAELLSWISSTLTGGFPIVILGDMNFGPDYPKSPSGLQIDGFTDAGFVDLWTEALASNIATANWGDKNNDGAVDMPLTSLTTRTHDTRRIDYGFLKNGTTSRLSLVNFDIPDLRANCSGALVPSDNFPHCPDVQEIQRWDTPDDFGVRPSDHNWLKITLEVEPDELSLMLAHELALFDVGVTFFPATPVLDNFDRTDEGPPPSANWSTGVGLLGSFFSTGHRVVGNQLAKDAAGDDEAESYWNAEQFGPDSECYVTVSTATGLNQLALGLRLHNIGSGTTRGYTCRWLSNSTARIYKIEDGVITELGASAASFTFTSGNKYGFRAVGSSLRAYVNSGSGWQLVLEVNDSSFGSQGYLGLFTDSTTSSRLDDFGGGEIAFYLRDSVSLELQATTDSLTLTLSDSVNTLADSIITNFGLGITDSNTLNDSLLLTANGLISIEDTLNVWQDAQGSVISHLIPVSDATNQLNDSLNTGYGADVSESIFFTDDSINSGFGVGVSDQFIQTDLVQLELGLVLNENLNNLADSENHTLEDNLEFSDNIQTNDSLALGYGTVISENALFLADHTNLGFGLVIHDSVTLSDSFIVGQEVRLDLSDGLLFSDSVALRLEQQFSFNETFTLTDQFTQTSGLDEIFAENTDNLSDSLAKAVNGVLVFSDSFTQSDFVYLGIGLVSSDDFNNWSDAIASNAPQPAGLALGLTDSLSNWQDSIASKLVLLFNFSDVLLPQNDGLYLGYGLEALESSNNLLDAETSEVSFHISSIDSFFLLDGVARLLGEELKLADQIVLNDADQERFEYRLGFSDSVNEWQEDFANLVNKQISATDNFVVSDGFDIRLGLGFFETLAQSDNLQIQLDQSFELADNSNTWTDQVSFVIGQAVAVNDDLANWLDTFELSLASVLSVSDTLELHDSIQLLLNHYLTSSDQVLLSDEFLINRATPGGLELGDNLASWQDQFMRRHRSIFGERTMSLDEEVRIHAIPEQETTPIESEGRVMLIEKEERGD